MEAIKWDVFTAEERSHIERLLARGEFDSIAKAISMDSLEKEYWVGKLFEEKKPIPAPIESKVASEMEREKMHGIQIDSPEKEAEWQAKFDEEKKVHEEKVRAKRTTKGKKSE